MKMSDLRAKARAIFGPAIAEPMPKQPNGAKALQQRANARPIPTYKVGGAVKKQTPPGPTPAERESARRFRADVSKLKPTKEEGEAIKRGNRAAAVEGGRYKEGGRPKKESYSRSDLNAARTNMPGSRSQTPTDETIIRGVDGSFIDKVRMNYAGIAGGLPSNSSRTLRKREEAYKAEGAESSERAARIRARNIDEHAEQTRKSRKEVKLRQLEAEANKPGASRLAKDRYKMAKETGMYKDGGKVHTSADTAKKLATEMGGMKDGGKAKKDGLAVMIAVGGPKKGMMDGGEIPTDMRASKLAVGGAGKTRKGQAPIKKAMGGKACASGGEMMKPVKRAQGGAGKVRKGMMTPEGQITHAMNKLRGK
jgi:hypothetical protein